MLAVTGPLVGVSFIGAVRTYAEASGLGGANPGGGQAFSPLVGIWAPTFSAYEVAAVFLLPFVAIRLVGGDRQSGAQKLELQQPITPFVRITTKALVLFGGWLIACLAAAVAVGLWIGYGGSTYSREILTVLSGHLLNAGFTIAFAAAAASITEHPSTAAILTFAFTVGTWVITFIAAVSGGLWEQIAAYTPSTMVAGFQHGLISLNVVLISIVLILTGFAFATIWVRLGVAFRRRTLESAGLAGIAALLILVCTSVHASWDVSENRQNSFPEDDEELLSHIQPPLKIEVHLAPEDPRRADLERRALSKLRRVLPDVQVQYISATSIGLFEQANEHYGEVWYDLGGRRTMNRLTTEEGVLETIFGLAGVKEPDENDTPIFTGHPLAVPPKGAALVFYLLWPLGMVAAATLILRRDI